MQVSFTRFQLDEIVHKLSIVRDDPDLLDSYELREEHVAAFVDTFLAAQPGQPVVVNHAIAACVIDELQDSIEIALANIAVEGELERNGLRDDIRSLRAAQRKLRSAIN